MVSKSQVRQEIIEREDLSEEERAEALDALACWKPREEREIDAEGLAMREAEMGGHYAEHADEVRDCERAGK